MADKILCDKQDLVDIADSVRAKAGTSSSYYVSELDEVIDTVKTVASLPLKGSADLTVSGATVTAPAGYYASNASKSVATATQAIPTISVNTSGLITASTTQSAGYISAGTKTATSQLSTQPAKTITPSANTQTAVAKGKYTTGAVTVSAVSTETKTVDLSMASGNQTISRASGKFMTSVTVRKPTTLTPENIKKDVTIGGVTGTLESGGSSEGTRETWVWKKTDFNIALGLQTTTISFISGGTTYTNISRQVDGTVGEIYYNAYAAIYGNVPSQFGANFNEASDRKITFLEPPTGGLLTYLQANAVKQASDVAVQPSKTVSVSETTTITPDAPYDAMAEVVANVSAGGNGYKLTFPSETDSVWGQVKSYLSIQKADGTEFSSNDWNDFAGKTFEKVVSICYINRSCCDIHLAIEKGKVLFTRASSENVTTHLISSNYYPLLGDGANSRYILLEDTVLSKFNIYDTD